MSSSGFLPFQCPSNPLLMPPTAPVPTNPSPATSDGDYTHFSVQSTSAPGPISSKGMGIGIAVCAAILLAVTIILWLLGVLPFCRKKAICAETEDLEGRAELGIRGEGPITRPSRALVMKVAKTYTHTPSKLSDISIDNSARSAGRFLDVFGRSISSDSNAKRRPSSSALTVATCNSLSSGTALEAPGGTTTTSCPTWSDPVPALAGDREQKAEEEREKDTTSVVTLETMKFRKGDGNSEVYEV